ncbi:MAG: MscL family protein [Candidatus Saccharimonadales bacterium]
MADKASKTTTKVAVARAKVVEKAQVAKQKAVSASPAKHTGGFLDFIRTQGVVGLAVGLAIGTAAGATVKSLVEGFINPIVQFIVGSQDALATATWHVSFWGRSADFKWGAAASSLITLLATALVIYWIVNVFKLDRLDKKKE